MNDNSNNPFNILGNNQVPQAGGTPISEQNPSANLNERIKGLITSDNIVLFMKGNPQMPQCGFSANVVAILNSMGVRYKTFDILMDMDIRQGLKEYSNWPTYPQLYVKGELMGGNDIVTEMYHSGELKEVLGNA